jgi:hypothetical protein
MNHYLVEQFQEGEGLECSACEGKFTEANKAPLYECDNDGLFNRDNSADGGSHRCPTCNKFGSKVGDQSCPICDEGPVETATVLLCPICEDVVGEDDKVCPHCHHNPQFWNCPQCQTGSTLSLCPTCGFDPSTPPDGKEPPTMPEETVMLQGQRDPLDAYRDRLLTNEERLRQYIETGEGEPPNAFPLSAIMNPSPLDTAIIAGVPYPTLPNDISLENIPPPTKEALDRLKQLITLQTEEVTIEYLPDAESEVEALMGKLVSTMNQALTNHTLEIGNLKTPYYFIGAGELGWGNMERVGDRYGMVGLFERGEFWGKATWKRIAPITTQEGFKGRLVAVVTNTRDSHHIGDMARGIYPSTPDVGDVVELGHGTLAFEDQGDGYSTGLYPDDGRSTDWLNPHSLYRVVHQDVELRFYPDLEEGQAPPPANNLRYEHGIRFSFPHKQLPVPQNPFDKPTEWGYYFMGMTEPLPETGRVEPVAQKNFAIDPSPYIGVEVEPFEDETTGGMVFFPRPLSYREIKVANLLPAHPVWFAWFRLLDQNNGDLEDVLWFINSCHINKEGDLALIRSDSLMYSSLLYKEIYAYTVMAWWEVHGEDSLTV